jgi:NADPH2:quinone reductase
LKIGFELMLTPMLRELDAARAKHVEILKQCAELIEQGDLKVNISHVLRLDQAADAHKLLAEGHMIGKIVLEM